MASLRSTRRRALAGIGTAIAMRSSIATPQVRVHGPILWLVSRGPGHVYLFPFGEARDRSWYTHKVQRALHSSSELWLELGAPPPPERLKAIYRTLGRESGRTFLEALDERTRSRALKYMQELAIDPRTVRSLRPWLAYYTFVAAFDKKFGHAEGVTPSGPAQLPPEYVLAGEAVKAHKPIRVELTMEEWLRKLADLSDHIQSQYLDWLFDWFDDERAGRNRDRFDWMRGHLVDRTMLRMHAQYPELYEVMDGERNRWWARKIAELIGRGGEYFAAIGQDHCADPEGIPFELVRLGVVGACGLRQV